MPPSVSLSMIVKDGANTLERCLASVNGLVDEVVIADTGSTDESPAIARRFGARVESISWADSFAQARNASLRCCRGEWIFWLDADEWLDANDRDRFRSLTTDLRSDEVYLMNQLSALERPESPRLSVAQPRLFLNGDNIAWQYRVHEQILASCQRRGDRICPTEIMIQHSGYRSSEHLRQKSARNLRLLELDHADGPDDPYLLLQLGRTLIADRFDEAEHFLERARTRFDAGDPARRQVEPLLVQGYRRQGRSDEARRAAAEGLARFPNDTGLLFETAILAFERQDWATAERAFLTLVERPAEEDEFLGAVDLSLRGWRAQHNLAVVYQRVGRSVEAEARWKLSAAEMPTAAQVWRGLAELYLSQSRWGELDFAVSKLEEHAAGSSEVSIEDAPLFRACARIGQGEFEAGRDLLVELAGRNPGWAWPRVLVARSFRFENASREKTRQAWRDVLEIEPANAEALAGLEAS